MRSAIHRHSGLCHSLPLSSFRHAYGTSALSPVHRTPRLSTSLHLLSLHGPRPSISIKRKRQLAGHAL
ncbi:hypothetical protein K439DRAFT_1642119, partial [Ramaria rubella]